MTPEPVLIADSSPLIALARINQLDLLRHLAVRVITALGLLRRARQAGFIDALPPQMKAFLANNQ